MNIRWMTTFLVASSTATLAFASGPASTNPKTAQKPYQKPVAAERVLKGVAPTAKESALLKISPAEKQRLYDAQQLQRKLAAIASQPAPLAQSGGHQQANPRNLPSTLALGGGDDCATPDAISGNGSFAFDNSLATTGTQGQTEASCLFFGQTGLNNDVWFAWTAPSNGTATFSLCTGTTMDSKIAVYNGATCPAGAAIACNDDSCSLQSQTTFTAVGGNTYMLQLGNFPGGTGGSGTFTMNVTGGGGGPANDGCSTPTAISGAGPFAFDTTGATTSAQQSGSCATSGHDLWYDWTASATGTVTFATCGLASFDTVIAVYDGAGCPAGGSLACNDDSCGAQSSTTFAATAGNHYMLQVGGFGASVGTGSFSLSTSVTGPANDECTAATAISGNGSFPFDSTAATTSVDGQAETACLFFGSTAIDHDLWYAWTAPVTGTATYEVCGGSSMDSKIAVYSGSSCPTSGSALACNDDFCALQSSVTFPVIGGSSYMLQLGTFPGASGGTGTFSVNVAPAANPDDCSTPTAISGNGVFPFDNSAATTGTEGQSEAACLFFGSTGLDNDVWYAWTAGNSGTATFSLCTLSTMDSKIAVYDGSSCPSSAALACNDDSCSLQSSLTFAAVAGNTYMLQIGNFPGGTGAVGSFSMNVVTSGPANDNCSAATLISGLGTFPFDTTGATTSAQQGGACGTSNLDVWYDWTAPSTGVCTLTLCNGAVAFDSLINVYDGSGCPSGAALACNDDNCGLVSALSFNAISGNSYMFQIGAFSTGSGSGSFDVNIVAPPAPCTPWDDGTTENLIGFNTISNDLVWANRFGAPSQVNTIDSVDVMWGSPLFPGLNPGNGSPTDVFIWVDGPTQDGDPSDATLLVSIPATVSNVDTDTYANFPIAPRTITGVFFVGTHQSCTTGQFPASTDQTAHPFSNVSWVWGDPANPAANYANPGANVQPPISLDAIGIPGQLCVRVNCSSGPATYLCEPGLGGVMSCPCSNPPSGSSRGCDNSAGTGGAFLVASGSANVAASTLAFNTQNQVASSFSMLVQGDALTAAGTTFGQGVRCVGGTLRRMYVHFSSGGSASFPGALDPDIATRSATLGDTLTSGATRWYSVVYRDVNVLGGCASTATFNVTNTAEVIWQ
ncbi:MAG: hypothetical protein IPJ19_00075 [Planctomycetes bacterium]|nr:hypothetical protein [Planctomycetota bacterium]